MLIIMLISGMVATAVLTLTAVKVFKACKKKDGIDTNKVVDASGAHTANFGGNNLRVNIDPGAVGGESPLG